MEFYVQLVRIRMLLCISTTKTFVEESSTRLYRTLARSIARLTLPSLARTCCGPGPVLPRAVARSPRTPRDNPG